jgi:hypothetical protein
MNTSSQRSYFLADRDLEAIAERDLWTAVFLQAIDDLTGTKGPNPRAIQKAAQRWFESTSEEPRAFLWLCIHLNLDPAAVLKSILHTARPERMLSRINRVSPMSIEYGAKKVPISCSPSTA